MTVEAEADLSQRYVRPRGDWSELVIDLGIAFLAILVVLIAGATVFTAIYYF